MRRSGFTLLELMIAAGLTLALAAGVLGFLWNMERVRGPVLAVSDRDRALDEWFDRLETDLAGAVSATRHGPGIDGGPNRLVVRTRRVGAGTAAGDRLADVRMSVHEFRAGAMWVGVGRDGGETPATAEMAPGVEALRFRYAGARSWADRFNSVEEGGLPAAVEVSLWLIGPGGSTGAKSGVEEEGDPGQDAAEVASFPERPADRVRVISIPDGGGF